MSPLSLWSLGRFSLTKGGEAAFRISAPGRLTQRQMQLPTVALGWYANTKA